MGELHQRPSAFVLAVVPSSNPAGSVNLCNFFKPALAGRRGRSSVVRTFRVPLDVFFGVSLSPFFARTRCGTRNRCCPRARSARDPGLPACRVHLLRLHAAQPLQDQATLPRLRRFVLECNPAPRPGGASSPRVVRMLPLVTSLRV